VDNNAIAKDWSLLAMSFGQSDDTSRVDDWTWLPEHQYGAADIWKHARCAVLVPPVTQHPKGEQSQSQAASQLFDGAPWSHMNDWSYWSHMDGGDPTASSSGGGYSYFEICDANGHGNAITDSWAMDHANLLAQASVARDAQPNLQLPAGPTGTRQEAPENCTRRRLKELADNIEAKAMETLNSIFVPSALTLMWEGIRYLEDPSCSPRLAVLA